MNLHGTIDDISLFKSWQKRLLLLEFFEHMDINVLVSYNYL